VYQCPKLPRGALPLASEHLQLLSPPQSWTPPPQSWSTRCGVFPRKRFQRPAGPVTKPPPCGYAYKTFIGLYGVTSALRVIGIEGGINIPLVFGAEEERPKWLSSRLRSRITPPGGRRGRRCSGNWFQLPALSVWVMRLTKSLASTFAELRDSLVCVGTLFASYTHQVCAWYSVDQSVPPPPLFRVD
jgi:hypothetical protein